MDNFTITDDIIFDLKADAVPFNYRISYKVSLICLIMDRCCGRRGCSAIKMQMISFAVSSSKAQRELIDSLDNENGFESKIVRFDPSINRAIKIALYDQIIYRQGNGLYRLTDKGNKMAKAMMSDETLLQREKEFLSTLSSKLTEEYIIGLSKKWGGLNATNQ